MRAALRVLMAAFAVLACEAGAPAEPRVVNPYFERAPDLKEVSAALFALGSNYRTYKGLVAMVCHIGANGDLVACAVPDTQTTDVNIKTATLSLAHLFRLSPRDRYGEDLVGLPVLTSINFGEQPDRSHPYRPSSRYAPDLRCAVAAFRDYGEYMETVEPPSPLPHMDESLWADQRRQWQTMAQAQDQQLIAFYEGRLSALNTKVDWRELEGWYMSDHPAEAPTNGAVLGECQGRAQTLRHLPQVPQPPPMY
jgi:hypothetical protein